MLLNSTNKVSCNVTSSDRIDVISQEAIVNHLATTNHHKVRTICFRKPIWNNRTSAWFSCSNNYNVAWNQTGFAYFVMKFWRNIFHVIIIYSQRLNIH